jgi:hypothetical protein
MENKDKHFINLTSQIGRFDEKEGVLYLKEGIDEKNPILGEILRKYKKVIVNFNLF